ncbi:MAG: DUF6263 family protein, partial [Verrucomicrobiota bacterium]
AAAYANAEKLLPPTYQVGKTYVFDVSQDMEMDMAEVGTALGQPGLEKTVVKMNIEMTAGCAAGEGKQKLVTSEPSRVFLDINTGGIQMAYDSEEPGSENSMLGPELSKLKGRKMTMTLDENGEVVEVEGLEDVAAAGPAGQMLGPDQLKQMINPAMQLGIPMEGVEIGDTWKNRVKMSLGGQVGTMEINFDLKYVRDEDVDGVSCAVVEYQANVDLEAEADGGAANPIEVKVENSEMSGEMKLDKDLRFFRIGVTKMDMVTSMGNPLNPEQTFEIPVKLTQTYKLKSAEETPEKESADESN